MVAEPYTKEVAVTAAQRAVETRDAVVTRDRPELVAYTRTGETDLETPFEKPVILPAPDNRDVAAHAWADARFCTDIMSEHGVFFALLMPPEVAQKEREEALHFAEIFAKLHLHISENTMPARTDVKAFTTNIVEEMKPFIDYKARLGEAQTNGTFRSLVWPLFFDHTRHEAERWSRRLTQLAAGESELDKDEVGTFWTNIMDEHARFVAHLLDPDEYELIQTAMSTSRVFADLHKGGLGGVASALMHEPSTVVGSLVDNPETDAILSAAETILEFKTKAARDIEAGRIKSIIDPRLADHVRREALKFVDEYRRAE